MNNLKLVFIQSTMICTGIVLSVGIEGLYYHLIGDDMVLNWYHMFSFLLAGVLGALPTLLFSSKKEMSRAALRVRWVLHFILLFVGISLIGYIFEWYTCLTGYLFVAVDYVVIYAAVVIVTMLLLRRDESLINKALDNIRDEE